MASKEKKEEDLKKFVICLFCVFISPMVKAATETINWYVDGNTYATTTCQTGGDITLPPAPTKYGYTFRGWEGYQFLEYIESTGTQYIDTGIAPNVNWTYEVTFDFSDVSPGWIMGSNVVSGGTPRDFGIAAEAIRFGTKYIRDIDLYSSKHTVSVNKTGYTIDGTDTDWGGTAVMTAPSGIYLFWAVGSGVSKVGRLYSFKIYDANNALTTDMIPVRRAIDGALGMYDTVTYTFFTNAGTGEFIAGPVINQ